MYTLCIVYNHERTSLSFQQKHKWPIYKRYAYNLKELEQIMCENLFNKKTNYLEETKVFSAEYYGK